MPACGAEYLGYGGNTTCFSIRSEKGWLIVDAGSGIKHVSNKINHSNFSLPLAIIFTHFHIDHIIGLPSFEPLYKKKTNLCLYGSKENNPLWKDHLKIFMANPFWPVGLGEAPANASLSDLPPSANSMDIFGIHVTWFNVPHPQKCLLYRIDADGRSIIIATDTEFENADSASDDFMAMCKKADYLLMDAQFTPSEYLLHKGWGHSSWETAANVAKKCCVRNLILIHHAPDRSDAELQRIQSDARQIFPSTTAAIETMSWKL